MVYDFIQAALNSKNNTNNRKNQTRKPANDERNAEVPVVIDMVNSPTNSEEICMNNCSNSISDDDNSLLDILSILLREETPAAVPNTSLISTPNLIIR